MTIKVIGAGFGRTGTASFKSALETLGFGPCYHMFELISHLDQLPLLQAARKGTLDNWELILQTYGSTTDWPACNYYQAHLRAYPDAKVVLTTRDPEKWYESVAATIYPITMRSTEGADPQQAAHTQYVRDLVWSDTFDGKFEDKAYAIGVFSQHIEQVKQNVPAEKLLLFDVQEGWEPLCAFLGVSVPAEPFPRLNDRKSINERFADSPTDAV